MSTTAPLCENATPHAGELISEGIFGSLLILVPFLAFLRICPLVKQTRLFRLLAAAFLVGGVLHLLQLGLLLHPVADSPLRLVTLFTRWLATVIAIGLCVELIDPFRMGRLRMILSQYQQNVYRQTSTSIQVHPIESPGGTSGAISPSVTGQRERKLPVITHITASRSRSYSPSPSPQPSPPQKTKSIVRISPTAGQQPFTATPTSATHMLTTTNRRSESISLGFTTRNSPAPPTATTPGVPLNFLVRAGSISTSSANNAWTSHALDTTPDQPARLLQQLPLQQQHSRIGSSTAFTTKGPSSRAAAPSTLLSSSPLRSSTPRVASLPDRLSPPQVSREATLLLQSTENSSSAPLPGQLSSFVSSSSASSSSASSSSTSTIHQPQPHSSSSSTSNEMILLTQQRSALSISASPSKTPLPKVHRRMHSGPAAAAAVGIGLKEEEEQKTHVRISSLSKHMSVSPYRVARRLDVPSMVDRTLNDPTETTFTTATSTTTTTIATAAPLLTTRSPTPSTLPPPLDHFDAARLILDRLAYQGVQIVGAHVQESMTPSTS